MRSRSRRTPAPITTALTSVPGQRGMFPREENFPFFPATPPGKTSPKLAFRGSPAMIERRWHDTCSVITDAATGRPTPHPQSFSP